MIGGDGADDPTNNVWVANQNFDWTVGPKLTTARKNHACSTMSIGTKSIIVVAGGVGDANANPITSVEILDPLSYQWVKGK